MTTSFLNFQSGSTFNAVFFFRFIFILTTGTPILFMKLLLQELLPSIGWFLGRIYSIALILNLLYPFGDGWPEEEHQKKRNTNDEGQGTNQIKGEPNIRNFH